MSDQAAAVCTDRTADAAHLEALAREWCEILGMTIAQEILEDEGFLPAPDSNAD